VVKVVLEIPVYNPSNGVQVLWKDSGRMQIHVCNGGVHICANSDALMSLARQMIYFAKNPVIEGSHIEYDDSFCIGLEGEYELILSKMED